ncbi:ascaris suum carboxypeptidase [Conidiobolus coronatus NRRL 28638]|uniref:Ascaris suum carboxypeptidase n=1 Tax=Conidiobolus coronatus (strain ATCC 28846 / CBS 209.66 / NRRL 28638) TaxID=796925 RepID=A0A137P9Z1_CONC2|nr:ascaris suum carboxypeptidase [Conidiobolus coronatus NRRL 28638]|eukprot:KXN71813.1 ascaris suum carboxypeptidase [Conidiobolus coronatus NRRL 28638]
MDESFHSNYHTSKEVFSYLQGIITSNPSMTKPVTIGSTHLGQEIKGIIVTNNIESKLTEQKPKLLIHGGQHAREWITVATTMFLIEEFINSKSALLDVFQIILVPILNVDGYDYTWDQDRLWRKNRQKDPKSNCMGIDLNRNWGDHWAPSTKNRCDETYPGSEPFLAPEIKALSQFILSQKNLLGYLDIHAYSQLWMYPFGYTCDPNLDVQNKYYELSYQVTQALAELYGTKYEFGPICNTIYAAYGSSVDWAYGKGNVKYPFTIELRDKGQYGFFLPKEQIIPTGKELMQGLLSFVQNMINIEKLKPIV